MAQETSGLTAYDDQKDTASIRLGENESEQNGETDSITSGETERLHSEIEETRENMSETIDAIQERLSLSNLSEQVSEKVSDVIESAKDTVYDATLGKVVNFMKQARDGVTENSVGRTVMANPIPFALIGAGSAMLIYNGFRKRKTENGLSNYRITEYTAPIDSEHQSAGLLSSAAEKISNKAGSAYETITDKAGSALDTINQKASDTYAGATDLASRTYGKVGEFGTSAKENYDRYVEEKPLAVAAAAVAVGAAIGFAIPSTRYEGRLMGEARDDLLSKAEDTASELVDKAKQVASDTSQVISKGSSPGGTQTF